LNNRDIKYPSPNGIIVLRLRYTVYLAMVDVCLGNLLAAGIPNKIGISIISIRRKTSRRVRTQRGRVEWKINTNTARSAKMAAETLMCKTVCR